MLPTPRPLTRVLLSLSIVVLLVNAKGRVVQHPSPFAPPADEFTFSEPSQVTTRHLALDLTVDFERRELSGKATLDLENLTGTRSLVLDTQQLKISRVTRDGGVAANYTLGAETLHGAPLRIDIEPSTRTVTVEYTTSTAAGALHWNTAAQSYGRVQPYLYTQNEPIDARSWIPIQDTPSVRFTYDATIRVPRGLLALMSAGNNARVANESGVYSFSMTQTIPAYLVALAVGRLEYHAFDARTGVYAEPELMDAAAHELQYMPEMLAAAERILGPHPFPRHDILLAPPTYIVGGMEHPMLNFLNPFSSVTGNHNAKVEPRNLLAHELAHSWAGDATTLGSWSDIWLNEGITSYLAARILEELGWRERAEHQWFLDRLSFEGLSQSVQNPEVTIMHRRLADPNFGFGATAYVKGALFIRTLEDLMGRTTLDRFLRDYFRSHAFRWADDRTFLARLTATLGHAPDASLRVDEWIYGTRLPSNVTAPRSSAMYDRMRAKVDAFNSGAGIASLDPQSWTEAELDLFLSGLNVVTIGPRLAEIDAALGLSLRAAPPQNWLRLAITNRYAPVDAAVERVLLRGGTNGNMTAIYGWLIGVNKPRAQQLFNAARARYHPNVATQVEMMLAQQSATINRAA